MPDEVKIPVRVEGADEAKADLASTGQAVQSLGGAQAAAAGGAAAAAEATHKDTDAKKLGDEATKKLTDSTINFSNKGEKLAKEALALVNPQLAQMADLALDAVQGVGGLSPALLAVAGVGAALGVVSTIFSKIAADAREADDRTRSFAAAMREMHAQGESLRGSLSAEMAKLGISGNVQGAAESVRRLMEQGIPRELAEKASIAAEATGHGVSDDTLRNIAAGILRRGGQLPVLAGLSSEQRERRIEALARTGSDLDSRRLLEGVIADVGDIARKGALAIEAPQTDVQEEMIARTARDRMLNEKDVEALRRLFRTRMTPGPEGRLPDTTAERVFPDEVNWWNRAARELTGGELWDQIRGDYVKGGTQMLQQIVDLWRSISDATEASRAGGETSRMTGGSVNVVIQNINTQHNERNPMDIRPSQSPEMQIQNASWR